MKLQLNTYRLLGRSGLRVSPLCLGAMTFGTEWGWGADKETSRRIFDHYASLGGNFVDTSNFYTNGTSEAFLGEFLRERREQFVLATKYSLHMRPGDPNSGGNHRKNLVQSLEASLRRLRTDYIDLYWLHIWEGRTPIDEVMRALDDVVRQGKVLYVGVSDMPAWKVAQANTLAMLRGWSPFIALQIEYSLAQRTAERDLIPMALDLGLGVTPWSPLAGGVLAGKYSEADLTKPTGPAKPSGTRKDILLNMNRLTLNSLQIANVVKDVAKDIGRTPSQVALAWLLHQPGTTSIIIGARTLEQLIDNLGCLDTPLSSEQLARLNECSRIELGFPHDFLRSDMVQFVVTGGAQIVQS